MPDNPITADHCFSRAAFWQRYAAIVHQTVEIHMNQAAEFNRRVWWWPFSAVDKIHAARHHKLASDAMARSRVFSGTAREFLTLGFQLRERNQDA